MNIYCLVDFSEHITALKMILSLLKFVKGRLLSFHSQSSLMYVHAVCVIVEVGCATFEVIDMNINT
jgi:hypothetical protein